MITICLAPLTCRPFIKTVPIFLLCMILFPLPSSCWAALSPNSLVTVEVHYEVPAAGEVDFFWGVNGWRPVDETIRPQGTKISNAIMSTPMARSGGAFTVTILTEIGTIVDYGFLIKKTASGAPLEMWDGDESYRFTVKESQVIRLQSKRMHQFSGVLADRAGITFFIILGIFCVGMAATCAFLLLNGTRLVNEPHKQVPDTRFAITVSVLAGLLGLLVITNHELWRDELQAWRLATSSGTIGELISNTRYEGHPAIWYLALYVVSRLSSNPIAMQLLHLLVGTSATFVFCKYSPFSKWQKASLSFGYFMFFEYFIVSRNYAFGVLALWSFCALRMHDPRRVVTSAVVLGFLANTSAFGAILAIAFGAWLLIEPGSREQKVGALQKIGIVSILALAVFLAGTQSAPPADNSPRMLTWNTAILGASLEKSLASVWKSYIPLPLNIPHFWNTNLLDELPRFNIGILVLESRDIEAMLSLLLIGTSILVLLRTPTIMMTYTFTTFALMFFLHTKVNHGIRHTGHLFLLLVACLWLSHGCGVVTIRLATQKLASLYTAILFVIQPLAGALCATIDLVYPFTASKAAAKFIEEQHFVDTMMVGSNWNLVSGIACYLNRPMYYVENGQTGTFSVWNKKRSKFSPTEVLEKAAQVSHVTNKDVLLILSYDPGASAPGLYKLASFERSVLTEERFWLFLLSKKSEEDKNL